MKACNEVISLLLNTSPVYFLHFRKKTRVLLMENFSCIVELWAA